MKKIIEGKRYDTETAEEIVSYWNGLGTSDFRHVNESLYKTKSGKFFLAGEGGPMSKYARTCGDMTSGGEDIIPLTPQEAQNWLEEHNFTKELEEHFTDQIQDA